MLAGGVGFANRRDALKEDPKPGEKIVMLGGDNYRIGMGEGSFIGGHREIYGRY